MKSLRFILIALTGLLVFPCQGHVATLNAGDEFGLFSETIPGVSLDQDSYLGSASGGSITMYRLGPDSTEFREGSESMRADVEQANTGWAGWFVQWGVNGTSEFQTIDMSKYSNGSLRFWLKAPHALQAGMRAGIRSAGVPAGWEHSFVWLRDFYPFDNQWHPVVIPIAGLAGPIPKAELIRIKVLFYIFLNLATNGPQSFYVDKVRWDTRNPGPLQRVAVIPENVTVPFNSRRIFEAVGLDTLSGSGNPIDIYPTWTMPVTNLGDLSSTVGERTTLTPTLPGSPRSGFLRATIPGFFGESHVTLSNINFPVSRNVYSDVGAGGTPGVAIGGNLSGPNPTSMDLLSAVHDGSAPEGTDFMRAVYTLKDTSPGAGDAFAAWFVPVDNGGTEFLRAYADGFLHFFVRTARDLEISIRTLPITGNQNHFAKIWLSDLAVPLDNTWQEVLISLREFQDRDPRIDFDQVQVFFGVAAISSRGGEVINEPFGIDDVKWLTTSVDGPNVDRVYQGLVAKQHPSNGLVRSFDTVDQAVTYDQALAAMAFTYRKDLSKAVALFERFNLIRIAAGAGFNGFYDTYRFSDPGVVEDSDRLVGPNAWLLLALVHYKEVSGSSRFDPLMSAIATWLRRFQDVDGGMSFGIPGSPATGGSGAPAGIKSTEHNISCYAAFKAYSQLTGNTSFSDDADQILGWLLDPVNGAWNAGESRFNAGENQFGAPDQNRFLDLYSWSVLSLPGDLSALLAQAETVFRNQKVNDRNGAPVNGFDFDDNKDAVWLEGTGHMVVAFQAVGDSAKAGTLFNQLKAGVINLSATTQGMTYATNGGTGFSPSFLMDSLNAAVSSMAWFLFADSHFNPLKPFPVHSIALKDMNTRNPATALTWVVNVPAGWVRANQYVQIDAQPVSIDPWGIQIYTDNAAPGANPRFIDPTLADSSNGDSNPTGLVFDDGTGTSGIVLPLAWSIKDRLADSPPAHDPKSGQPNSFQWIFTKDRNTPDIDFEHDGTIDVTQFVDADSPVLLRNANGIHGVQGPAGFFPSLSSDFVFIEANFNPAFAQASYKTKITIEFFTD